MFPVDLHYNSLERRAGMDQRLAIAVGIKGPPTLPIATEATLPSRMFLDGHKQRIAGGIANPIAGAAIPFVQSPK